LPSCLIATSRGMGPCVRRDDGKPKPLPRHVALGVAGHAGAADLGPDRVDLATNANAHLARQRRTALAVAAHAGLPRVDELFRDQRQCLIVLDAEARPVLRIAAAG